MNRTPKLALIPALLSFALISFSTNVFSQEELSKSLPDGFTLLKSGLEYKIVSHGNGKRKPALTDHVELNISYQVGDSLMFDSRKMNNNKPVPIPITKPRGPGDPVEVFMLMVEGDSAIVRFPVDSIKKTGQAPPWAKDGDKITYKIKLVSVKTEAEDKKENEEKAARQTAIDDEILKDYFKKNNIKAKKTASGLYYSIKTEGKGENIKPGETADVNYTGMFMDGKKFDSNTDSGFHHVTPFTLEVGKGHVIKGWDEGLQLLKLNSIATFYIPSTLAYGSSERQGIPANSILIFDVAITSVKTAEQVIKDKAVEAELKQKEALASAGKQVEIDDKLLQDYFAKNNIKANKTASGLYYVISQKGLGPNAKAGKKITMNYTGKTLDGNVFDSNTDPKFSHVSPFSFTLGQGQVIKGWDEGVQLLKLGSKGTLYIPSYLGYGATGAGKAIPPNAILIFDVEVSGIDN